MDEIKDKLDYQNIQIDYLLNFTDNLKCENKKLKVENETLRLQIVQQEQYSRRNYLEIHGIPEVHGENVISEVLKVGRAVGFSMSNYMIDNCRRIGKNNKNGTSSINRGIIKWNKKDAVKSNDC